MTPVLSFAKPAQKHAVPFGEVSDEIANGPTRSPYVGFGDPGFRQALQHILQGIVFLDDVCEQFSF